MSTNQDQEQPSVSNNDNNDSTSESKNKPTLSEKGYKAEKRIDQDKYDTEAWTILMEEVQNMDIENARSYYERFLETFPTAGRYWKFYAEHEAKANNHDKVEEIFRRCLLKCLNVELWKCYLGYIRNTKTDTDEIQSAYEFTLDHVGMDMTSTSIWREYINFLKEKKVHNQSQEAQKISSVRKAYLKAIQNPMHGVDKIWDEYEEFEEGLNKVTGKSVAAEHINKFKTALARYRDKRSIREGLLVNMLAKPPSGSAKEEQQVKIWRKLIEFEKRNSQRLTSSDLHKRVTFTYNQSLLCLYHYPDIWIEASMYQMDTSHPEDAKEFFERGLKALPDNILLHFAYADFEESRKNINEATEIYQKLLEIRDDPIIHIQLQKFARRQHGMNEARYKFLRARKSKSCTYHMYIAAANMEYELNNDHQKARHLFDLGLKEFIQEPEYVLAYLDLLERLHDTNNRRVLFEKVLQVMPSERSKEIWNRFLEFEYLHGDQTTISKAESRRSELFPDLTVDPITSFINRCRFMDLWPCSPQELELIERRRRFDKNKKKKQKQPVKHVKPDLSQMVEFNPDEQGTTPTVQPPSQIQPTAGNGRPSPSPSPVNLPAHLPPNISNLPDPMLRIFSKLPAPQALQGRFPDSNYVFDALRTVPLPASDMGSRKRKRSDVESEKEYTMQPAQNKPPPDNTFRLRKQKRLRTNN
eukprot:gb/GECH01004744.1/.p1 GENE.gb/GECH01004744.1/~~gb/GECH01004744.1/.p1  ORF type:complete len:697 (+),score=189.74 gb/GECH01004744.1/:1-2091(+)